MQHFSTLTPEDTEASAETGRVGVEVEFGGLSERQVAKSLAIWLGGRSTKVDAYSYKVSSRQFGHWVAELDTAWRDEIALAGDLGASVAREIIPVEIVTPPLQRSDLGIVDTMLRRLAALGARGSRSTLVGAYGIHFNPEEHWPQRRLVPIARSFAALEPWLRHVSDLDIARRALPFINPWPPALVRVLLSPGAAVLDAASFATLYLQHVRTRNHGLDLLPILRHLDGATVNASLGATGSARPTYHFRLPECRLDEAGWSLQREWAKWRIVETVADNPGRLATLTEAVADANDPVDALQTALSAELNRREFTCLVL